MQIAYLSQGRLFLKLGDAPPRQIESPFALSIADRDSRTQQRHGWRNKATIGGAPEGFLWNFSGGKLADPNARRAQFVSVARSGADELIYVLDTDRTSGLFVYQTRDSEERRLVHRKEFRPRDLARHPADGRLVCSVRMDDGSARIAVMEADGTRLREMTEGDAVDESPVWAPGTPGTPGELSQIVYQSAGIARDRHGVASALGPYAIMRLDIDRGDLTPLLEDEATDYLRPRMAADGALYFIRRPYQAWHRVSPLHVVGDVLLFPFRLLRAIFHFLNFFSVMFSQKPLTTAGGPKMEGPDQRFLMLYGRVIDTQKAMKATKGDAARSLVPANWELVQQKPNGSQSVLARSVVSFDLAPDGGVVYTDGGTIYHRPPDGPPRAVCSGKMIESVVVTA